MWEGLLGGHTSTTKGQAGKGHVEADAQSEVNGANMNEVFAWLKAQPEHGGIAGSTSVKW